MRLPAHPEPEQFEITRVMHALSDPIRLQVLRELGDTSRCCGDLVVPVKPATLSHHLKVLREAGVVAVRADGSRRWYELRRADLDGRFPGLLDVVLTAC